MEKPCCVDADARLSVGSQAANQEAQAEKAILVAGLQCHQRNYLEGIARRSATGPWARSSISAPISTARRPRGAPKPAAMGHCNIRSRL